MYVLYLIPLLEQVMPHTPSFPLVQGEQFGTRNKEYSKPIEYHASSPLRSTVGTPGKMRYQLQMHTCGSSRAHPPPEPLSRRRLSARLLRSNRSYYSCPGA